MMHTPILQAKIELIKALARHGSQTIEGMSIDGGIVEIGLLSGENFSFKPTNREVCRYMKYLNRCPENKLASMLSRFENFLSQDKLGIRCILPESRVANDSAETDLGSCKLPKIPPELPRLPRPLFSLPKTRKALPDESSDDLASSHTHGVPLSVDEEEKQKRRQQHSMEMEY